MTTLPQTATVRFPRAVVSSPSGMPAHTGPANASAAPAGMTGADVWRVLRGNLWLIVIMVMGFAVAGFFTNMQLAKYAPKYTAVGLLRVSVNIEVPKPGERETTAGPDLISVEQSTQSKMLEHENLFMETLQDPASKIRDTAWFRDFTADKSGAAGQFDLGRAKESWEKNWSARPVAGSRLLRLEMTYSEPDDCKAIVEEFGTRHITKVRDNQLRIEEKKVDLLRQELKLVEIELNEEIRKQLREKELALGLDQVGTSLSWSGKQFQLDRLLQEEARIRSELAGYQSRMKTVLRDLDEGRTPAEVEQQINNSGRYLMARQRADDIDIEIDQLAQKLGPHHELVVAYKKRKDLYQQKLDETREELKSTFSETIKSMFQNEIDAANSNAGRVEEAIQKVSGQLGDLNRLMNEHRQLQQREQELVRKQSYLNEEITKIRQFAIQAPWATAEWASHPQKPDRPSFPKLYVTMGVAVFLGLALSLGIAFLRELTDNTVRSPRDIARVGQLTLLGIVPHESDDPQAQGGRLALALFDTPNSMTAEQFRQVRTRLQQMASLDTTRSILFTSPSPDDGKTTVACNVAAALALNGRRILLVDSNFRRPQLHTVFNVPNDVGFADALADADKLAAAVRESEVPNLVILPSGVKPANATELLESQLFIDFVERALEEYDHVIFDGGPLLMSSESVAMAPRVDGVITVVRARGNSRGLLMRMRDELKRLRAENLGVILNAVRSQGGGYYGRNIRNYYAYQNS